MAHKICQGVFVCFLFGLILFCGVFLRHSVLCILWMKKLLDFGRGFCPCNYNQNQILTTGSTQYWLFFWRKQMKTAPTQKRICSVMCYHSKPINIMCYLKNIISSSVFFILKFIHELQFHKTWCSVCFKSLFNCIRDSFLMHLNFLAGLFVE